MHKMWAEYSANNLVVLLLRTTLPFQVCSTSTYKLREGCHSELERLSLHLFPTRELKMVQIAVVLTFSPII